MTTIKVDPIEKLQAALAAEARSPDIPEAEDAYGWLVGSWDLDVLRYWAVDVASQNIKGEVHAAWALEGSAVQDVWIMPSRGQRPTKPDKQLNMFGTTLRAWDASIHAWRITWCNPAGDHFEHQIGRWIKGEVVQVGARPDGSLTRWRFVEITKESFHWLGESLALDGQTWNVEGEFLARRTH